MATITHSKVSTLPDSADTSLVRPTDWNADHVIASQSANTVLAGPSSGGPATPAFRAITLDDLPAAWTIVSKTGNYTPSPSELVLCSTTASGFTITLPTAAGIAGKTIAVKKTTSDGNLLTVGTTSSQTIDGLTVQAWTTQYDTLVVVSDGSNWMVV